MSAQEYVTVTMDLQGILELKMITDPQVDFVFNSIQKYQTGITKYNATVLEVNATVPWDLYAQPATQYWNQQAAYGIGNRSQNMLPAEILQLQTSQTSDNFSMTSFNGFIGLTSNFGTNLATQSPTAATQFISGNFGSLGNNLARQQEPVRASEMNQRFSIHYRIKPGVPATFPDLNVQYPAVASTSFSSTTSTQSGYYILEVVYTLAEDL